MSASYASNAVMTKTRAKYGHRLTVKDLHELCSLSNISDIVNFLRTHSHFSSELENVSDSGIHRKNLERLLRRNNLNEIQNICHFEKTVGEHLFEYILQKIETEAIITFIRFLVAGRPEEYILDLSYTFNSYTKIDLLKLSRITCTEELKSFLKSTSFAKVASLLPDNIDEPYDFAMIEAAMDRITYQNAFDTIKKSFSGDTLDELIEMLSIKAELYDFMLIYRAKRFYNVSDDIIRSELLGFNYYLTPRMVDRMIAAKTDSEVLEIFRCSRYSKRLSLYKSDISYNQLCEYIIGDTILKKIHFSSHAPVVMLAYIFSSEIEIDNLTTIIEGVRYKMPPEQILENLILNRKESESIVS